MHSFVTGSHAYGQPNHDSDIDLVVLLSKNDLRRLINAGGVQDHVENDNYLRAGGLSLRFGKLNLICCLSEKLFDVWKKGTRKLKKQKPVSRAFAVKYMQKLRDRAGFRDSSGPDGTPPSEEDIPF